MVEGERDQLRGIVDKLQKEVEGLRGVEEEAASYKGKAMQQAQALEKATAAITKAGCEMRRLKANTEKPKARVEGREGEGRGGGGHRQYRHHLPTGGGPQRLDRRRGREKQGDFW